MNRLAIALPVLALTAVLAVGCSSSGPSSTGSSGGSTGSTAPGTTGGASEQSGSGGGGKVEAYAADPCSAFSASDINAALHTTVAAGSKSAEIDGRCDYKATSGASVYVSFTKTAEADFSGELANAKSYQKTPTKVGDDSVYSTLLSDSLGIQVIEGGYLCTIGMNSVKDPKDATLRAGLLKLADDNL